LTDMKLIAFIFFVLAPAMPLAAQGLLGANHNKSIREGNLEYKKGTYKGAMDRYSEVLESKPTDPVANFNLGTALYKSGKVDSAMTHFNQAIRYTKDDHLKSKAYYNVGNTYLNKRDLENAITSYKQSLKLDPGNESARYNLAYATSLLQKQQQQQQQQQQAGDNAKDGGEDDGIKKQDKGDQKIDDPDRKDDKNKQPQQPQNKMTKDKAEQLLNALNNREKETLKDMKDKDQRPSGGTKTKDW